MNKDFRCVMCQHSGSVMIREGVLHANEMDVYRCVNCGLVFLLPRSTEQELNDYYKGLYRKEYNEPLLCERYQEDIDEAYKRVYRLLHYFQPNTSLLDVGCGSGAFLNAVRPHVDVLVGVEPDKISKDWIEDQLKIRVVSSVNDIIKEGKTFDFIGLFHVLEHVNFPVDFLCDLKQLMHKGSRLVIEVPNINDILVSIYKVSMFLDMYYQKAHLYYFSRNTLGNALEQAGFSVDIQGIQRYGLSNHIHWMLTGKPSGTKNMYPFLTSSVLVSYVDSLIESDHSDTLWAIAQT